MYEFLSHIRRPYDAGEEVIRNILNSSTLFEQFVRKDPQDILRVTALACVSEHDQLLTELLQIVISLLIRSLSTSSFSSSVTHKRFLTLFLFDDDHGKNQNRTQTALLSVICSLIPGNIFRRSLIEVGSKLIVGLQISVATLMVSLTTGLHQAKRQLQQSKGGILMFTTLNRIVHLSGTCVGLADVMVAQFNELGNEVMARALFSGWNDLVKQLVSAVENVANDPSCIATNASMNDSCFAAFNAQLEDSKATTILSALCSLLHEMQKSYMMLLRLTKTSQDWWLQLVVTRCRRILLLGLFRFITLPLDACLDESLSTASVGTVFEWVLSLEVAVVSCCEESVTRGPRFILSEDFWRSNVLSDCDRWAQTGLLSLDDASHLKALLCPDEWIPEFRDPTRFATESSLSCQKLTWFDTQSLVTDEENKMKDAIKTIQDILAGDERLNEELLRNCLKFTEMNVEKTLDMILSDAIPPELQHKKMESVSYNFEPPQQPVDNTIKNTDESLPSVKDKTLMLVQKQQENDVREAMREGAILDIDAKLRQVLPAVLNLGDTYDEDEDDDELFKRHYITERRGKFVSATTVYDDERDDEATGLVPYQNSQLEDTAEGCEEGPTSSFTRQQHSKLEELSPAPENERPRGTTIRRGGGSEKRGGRRPMNHHRRDRRDAKLNRGMLSPFNP